MKTGVGLKASLPAPRTVGNSARIHMYTVYQAPPTSRLGKMACNKGCPSKGDAG
jgi:hypothetical protein